jgi:hypothetical protein
MSGPADGGWTGREIGRLTGQLAEVDHRVDRAMERIDDVERAAADRAVAVQERLARIERLAEAATPGAEGLTKPERIALVAGAPVVIAALIAALVEIARILGG